jgi:hypothetical protein
LCHQRQLHPNFSSSFLCFFVLDVCEATPQPHISGQSEGHDCTQPGGEGPAHPAVCEAMRTHTAPALTHALTSNSVLRLQPPRNTPTASSFILTRSALAQIALVTAAATTTTTSEPLKVFPFLPTPVSSWPSHHRRHGR